MKEKRFSGHAILITAAVTVVLTLAAAALAVWLLLGRDGLAVVQGLRTIERRFVGEYSREEVTDSALAGMVYALGDRWSGYLTAEQVEEMNRRRENRYIGVGLTYTLTEESFLHIEEVTQDGPAQKAGLGPGMVVTAIGGTTLTAENLQSCLDTLGGEEGQEVTLTARDGQGVSRDYTVTLASIETDPVESEMMEGDVGYVRLKNFYYGSADRLREAVEELVDQGARGILFDVRSNPGGFVSELTAMLDYLLPEGPIFAEHAKGEETKITQSDAACVDLPMAVLVNADSYSAAEIFAAQLRESVGAAVVGQVTSGKGYYQQALPLMNGGAMNISTGMYTTGGGLSLIGTGLTPDVLTDDAQEQRAEGLRLLREAMDANRPEG